MSFNNTTTPSHDCVRVDIFPLFVFAFVVNVFALIAVSKAKPRGRAYNATRQIHMLIFCLSLSDTTSVALQCIMPVTSFINCGWFGGKASCNVFGYISAVLVVWSAWIVVYLSFQRFLVTVYPFRYRDYFTTTKISYLLISGFIVQCGFFTPPFLGVGEFVYYETGQFCSLSLTPTGKTDTIYLGTLVAQGFLCVTLTIICNISVLISLRSRKSIFSGLTLYSLQSSTSTFMSLTKAVALMFCVCYIPFLIRVAVDLCKQTSFEELGLQHTITMALLFVNTLANPFIYVACRKRYRHSLKQICFGCCSRLKRIAPAPEHSVFVLNYVRKTSQQTKNERKTTASL